MYVYIYIEIVAVATAEPADPLLSSVTPGNRLGRSVYGPGPTPPFLL